MLPEYKNGIWMTNERAPKKIQGWPQNWVGQILALRIEGYSLNRLDLLMDFFKKPFSTHLTQATKTQGTTKQP